MMRGFALAAGLVCAGLLSIAPAWAVTFVLESGESFEGAILHATRNTITIRPAVGGIRQIPIGRLKQVQTTTDEGETLRGNYRGWLEGRVGIEVGSELLWLQNQRVVARKPLAPPVLAEGGPPAPSEPASSPVVSEAASAPAVTQPASELAATEPSRASAVTKAASEAAAIEPAGAAAGTDPVSAFAAIEPASASTLSAPASAPRPARSADRTASSVLAPMPPGISAPDPLAETESVDALAAPQTRSAPAQAAPAGRAVASVIAPMPPSMPVPEPAAGAESVALPPRDLPAVSITAAPHEVTEKSGEIVFTLELSRPIDDLLVVIYSTVDGGARSGADYEASQGILTLPAGATREQFRTAVFDDGEAEGDEEFQLFVATNPELTEVAQQWLRVTIHDDD